jgi:hypothetical protein
MTDFQAQALASQQEGAAEMPPKRRSRKPQRRLVDGAESKTKGCQTDWLIVLGSDQLDQSVRKGTAPAQIIVPANKLLIVNLISFG